MTLRGKSKYLIKSFLLRSNLLNIASRFTRKSIAILKYHSIQNDPKVFDDSIDPGIIHNTSVFRKQMEAVAKTFNSVSMDDILFFLEGRKDIPNNSIAVTFDDGFLDNYELAAPILDYYGIPATFYITVGSIENELPPWFLRVRHAIWTTPKREWIIPLNDQQLRLQNRDDRVTSVRLASKYCASLAGIAQEEAVRNIESELDVESFMPGNNFMMNWNQIKKLLKSGHIIGSHTVTHPNVAHLSNDDLLAELRESKHVLESKLNERVVHFSYPNPALHPHLTDLTRQMMKQVGYKTAVISTPGGLVCADSDPLLLKRVWVPNHPEEFLWHLQWTLLGRSM